MNRLRIPTILLGILLVAVITPLSQFLTISSVDAAVETSTPVGWAVGIVFSLILVTAVVRLVSRWRLLSKESVVVLYCMLTIAAPVMNLGLLRPLYHSLTGVLVEYLYMGTSTYRTAYNARNSHWFPLVPDNEGLVWSKADRLLSLLRDPKADKARLDALRRVTQAIGQQSVSGSPDASRPVDLDASIALLGVDEIESLRAQKNAAALASLGIVDSTKERYSAAAQASEQASRELLPMLSDVDEFEASQLPENLAELDPGSLKRLRTETRRLGPEPQRELDRKLSRLNDLLPVLREKISKLGEADFIKLRNGIKGSLIARYATLSHDELDQVRTSYIYRLTRKSRSALMEQTGHGDTPNENLKAFRYGLWSDLASQQAKERRTLRENLSQLFADLPWHLWVVPLLLWGTLLTALFLFVMCAAEWFRRKWVDRENLAFPLVEVADNIIRHDARLESADDLRSPAPRQKLFSVVFLIGCAVGFAVLSLEALGHYQIIGKSYQAMLNVSQEVFTTGGLKEMDKVIFVLSPIVVGLMFLVSLEISFSVWASFVIYQVIVLIPKLSGADIKDSSFTGYGGGRDYPFPMEQLLGASLCFAAVLLYKSFRARSGVRETGASDHHFIPPALTRVGLFGLPVLIAAMCWSMGVTNLPLLTLTGLVTGGLAIAGARVRAETGLPSQHVSYEFSKLPLVFGLTGITGAKVYTVFLSLVFLPVSLLFRTLPQHLENMELARRFKIKYQTVALSGLCAFLTALVVGMFSFLVFSYYRGETFSGSSIFGGFVPENISSVSVSTYPLYLSHFRGEAGLGNYTEVHWIRVGFMLIGFGAFGLLTYLRGRFLRFPLHPIGYLVLLFSLWYAYVSPYARGDAAGNGKEVSFLWGSALVAWALKKTIIKYGGMNMYKQAKPFFIGLVAGSVFAIFAWNAMDLTCSIVAEENPNAAGFVKFFADKPPYSPRFY